MNNSLLAGRYAKALLLQAESEGVAEVLYGLLKPIVGSVLSLPEVERVLASPTHTRGQKKAVLMNLSDKEWPALWERFVDLVLAGEREAFMAQIARRYLALYRQRH
ncbi:MAG: F0F1 ATP synthase subunit delta, partial [Tidjanibacter sp.]|nr:F0F1 ATP synthase subunit delta [Tidjanibacter sp.]